VVNYWFHLTFPLLFTVTKLQKITSTICCSKSPISGKLHYIFLLTLKPHCLLIMIKNNNVISILTLFTQDLSIIISQFLGVLFIYGLYSKVNQWLVLKNTTIWFINHLTKWMYTLLLVPFTFRWWFEKKALVIAPLESCKIFWVFPIIRSWIVKN
jgi:hypothetical protein